MSNEKTLEQATIEGQQQTMREMAKKLQHMTMLLSAIVWREGGVVVTAKDIEDVPPGQFEAKSRKDGDEMALRYVREEFIDE